MKTISVKENQTLLDIALQYYGTAEAVDEILTLNREIKNDPAALVAENRALGYLYPDIKLKPGVLIQIDDESLLLKKTVVKKIERDVTTYTSTKWQERLIQ